MLSSLKVSLYFLLLFCFANQALCDYSIKGDLSDSERKYSNALLEYIPSIFELNTIDFNNIIERVPIDSEGSFSMSGSALPKEKRLYRLSLLKGNQSSGITTGLSKNYIFLELDGNSQIEITKCEDVSNTFANCLIMGSPASQEIQQFFDEIRQPYLEDYSKMIATKTEIKEKFLREKYISDVKNFCDSSRHLLSTIVAFMNLENWEKMSKDDIDFFSRISQKIEASDSPYAIELKNEFISQKESAPEARSDYSRYLILFLSLSLLSLGAYTYFTKRQLNKHKSKLASRSVEDIKERIDTLSKKEIEVYQLIAEGKSNKEIASALYVELTTIKSHISKVYQKLGVKNRKEATEIWTEYLSK